MDLGLAGKTAVVAGGSRGCGRGISEVLAAEGAAVVFSGRNREPVAATESAIRSAGGKAAGVVADMTTHDGALSIIRAAQKQFGDPDILVVNSPGRFRTGLPAAGAASRTARTLTSRRSTATS